MPAKNLHKHQSNKTLYRKIRSIDGTHPFQDAVQGGFVSYRVRKKKRGKLTYFNFPLAKEMGLIDKSQVHEMTDELSQALLDTFSIQIVNEHDIINKKKFPDYELKDNLYMATRYLQLQHPNKQGITSGDGRSIWNGVVEHDGVTWDISSCGTGATCLSPATAIHKRFFRTGDPMVSYGCGYSTVSEGIIDVLFSEILTKNKIDSERILCVIEYPGSTGITVRAGKNLLRPSHFFNHLKQEQLGRLKQVTDYYIHRQVDNGDWPDPKTKPYELFLQKMVETFADIAAKFEAHYIFCWLDWDGDNILADGGIIDFGSVRQFGLYHHEYKFDDHERWSTNIKEQRAKARYTVQTFAQMVDYLKTGKRKPIAKFSKCKAVKQFDDLVQWRKCEETLWRVGFQGSQIRYLMRFQNKEVERLVSALNYFEQIKSKSGMQKTADGINWDVLTNVRSLLSGFNHLKRYHSKVEQKQFEGLLRSTQSPEESLPKGPSFRKRWQNFENAYDKLVKAVMKNQQRSQDDVIRDLAHRAEQINKPDRITGDSICLVSDVLLKQRKKLSFIELDKLIHDFVNTQIMNPDFDTPETWRFPEASGGEEHKLLQRLMKIVHEYREGI